MKKIFTPVVGRRRTGIHIYICSCGTMIESSTPVVEKIELYKEDRDVSDEETGKVDECDMDEFGRLFVECIKETIAILRD